MALIGARILLFFCLVLYGQAQTQINFAMTSRWQYGVDVTTIFVPQDGCSYTSVDMLPNVTFYSDLGLVSEENTRLTDANINYVIGEPNNLFNFILPTLNATSIFNFYPTDNQIMDIVIATVNRLFAPNAVKSGIAVIINQTKSINNLDMGNYQNIITRINQQNWTEVKYIPFTTITNVIYNLRLTGFTTTISLLYDPATNLQLVESMYLNKLMTWMNRWIIVDLLGGNGYLTNPSYNGRGLITNNVTIITFATSSFTGQQVLIRSAYEMIQKVACPTSTINPNFLSGAFQTVSPYKRLSFVYYFYQNPGQSINFIGSATVTLGQSVISLPPNLVYIPYAMSLTESRRLISSRTFYVGWVEYPPYSQTLPNGTKTGFFVQLLSSIFADLNVTYQYVPVNPSLYNVTGNLNTSTMVYNGLLGVLQSQDMDTLSVPILITVNRLNTFDFGSNLQAGYINVLYKVNQTTGLSALSNFVTPFTWQVWVTLLACAIGVAIALMITDYLHPDKEARYRLLMSLFFSISSLTHGAYFNPPERPGARIVMSFWWLFCLWVVIFWGTNYSAFLISQQVSKTFTSFYDIMSQTRIGYGTINDNLLFKYLASDIDPQAQTMYNILNNEMVNGTMNSISDAIALVNTGTYGLIYDNWINQYYAILNCLNTFGTYSSYEYGFTVPKNSENLLAIQERISNKMASGYISSILTQFWPTSNQSCASQNPIDSAVTTLKNAISNGFVGAFDIDYMVGIFTIILVGAVATLILAAIEKLIRLMIQKRNEARNKAKLENVLHELNF